MFTVPLGTTINPKLVEDAIKYNETFRAKYNESENYYIGNHEILDRQRPTMKKNNRVVVNHAKYIVDMNVGYLLGNPVEYQATEGYEIEPVLDLYKQETIGNIDHEIATDVATFGRAYERVYTIENRVKSTPVDPRNCIVVYDDTVEHSPMFAVIYKKGEKPNEFEDVQVLDKFFVYPYSVGGKIQPTTDGIQPHFFGKVPVVEYRNNGQIQSDFEQVKSMINAYNLIQSDRVNDKEQLVDAIMAIYGLELTAQQKEEVKTSRVISGLEKDAKIEYIVKTLNEADVDVLRQVLEQDIHKISMVPNMADENFAGNSSGVALKYKLLAFEQNTKNKERYFETGLKKRFELYNNYLVALNQMSFVPTYEVDVIFKRNLPQNDYETSQMITNLVDIADKETLLGQLSFIHDAKEVLEAKRIQDDEEANMDNNNFGTDEATQLKNEIEKAKNSEDRNIIQKLSDYLK